MALGAGITLLQPFLHRFLEKDTITLLVIGGMLLVIAAFAWAYAAITCPDCKLKLFWYSLTKVGLGTWFVWLTDLEHCPQCEQAKRQAAQVSKRVKRKAR